MIWMFLLFKRITTDYSNIPGRSKHFDGEISNVRKLKLRYLLIEKSFFFTFFGNSGGFIWNFEKYDENKFRSAPGLNRVRNGLGSNFTKTDFSLSTNMICI